jgi:hypothetical protein
VRFWIFINRMSINFLLQAVRIIHIGNYDDTEIRMIYDYLRNLDNATLFDYFNSYTVLQYNSDLEFCIEVIDKMIKVLEDKEEYEKCQILLNKKEESLDIMKIKIGNYEHI